MSATHLVPQLAILAFAGLVVWAAVSDVRVRLIPNASILAIAALYPAYVASAPHSVNWIGALLVAGATLAVGFGLYLLSFKGMPLMGAGDTKLLTVSALWAGPAMMFDLLIVMAAAGGLIAVYTWLRHSDLFVSLSAWLQLRLAPASATASGASLNSTAGAESAPAAGSEAAPPSWVEKAIVAVSTRLHIPDVALPYGVAICAGALYVAIVLLLGV